MQASIAHNWQITAVKPSESHIFRQFKQQSNTNLCGLGQSIGPHSSSTFHILILPVVGVFGNATVMKCNSRSPGQYGTDVLLKYEILSSFDSKRNMTRLTGVLIGHNSLNKHLHIIRIINSSL